MDPDLLEPCPHCGLLVSPLRAVCRHCGAYLNRCTPYLPLRITTAQVATWIAIWAILVAIAIWKSLP